MRTSGLIWIDHNVDLDVLGFYIPVPWFNSIDSFVSIVSVPVLFALWRCQAARGGEPGEIVKIATGAFIASAGNLMLVIACLLDHRVPRIFQSSTTSFWAWPFSITGRPCSRLFRARRRTG